MSEQGCPTCARLNAELTAARGEAERLRGFAEWACEAALDGHGLDGGDIQDTAEAAGILVTVEMTEPCCDDCRCAEFDDITPESPAACYRLAWSKAARAALAPAAEATEAAKAGGAAKDDCDCDCGPCERFTPWTDGDDYCAACGHLAACHPGAGEVAG